MKATSFLGKAGQSLLALILGSGSAFGASEYTINKDKSEVQFVAIGKPGFLKIRGEGGTLAGKLAIDGAKITGELTAGLKELKTGIDLRDEHMHGKYLETAKYPTAVLTIKEVQFENGSEGDCTFAGALTIKGKENSVTGSCEAKGVGTDNLSITAKTEIKMADFPVGVPSHLGITVAEKVEISANVIASKSPVLQN